NIGEGLEYVDILEGILDCTRLGQQPLRLFCRNVALKQVIVKILLCDRELWRFQYRLSGHKWGAGWAGSKQHGQTEQCGLYTRFGFHGCVISSSGIAKTGRSLSKKKLPSKGEFLWEQELGELMARL